MKIMEGLEHVQRRILIESQWNLNCILFTCARQYPIILIESQWNLNKRAMLNTTINEEY